MSKRLTAIDESLREALGPRVEPVLHEAVVVELAPRGPQQLMMLRQHIELARFVYNWALDQHRSNGWPIGGKAGIEGRAAAAQASERGESVVWAKRLSSHELSRRWTQEVDRICPWARTCARSPVTYALKAVEIAYDNAFRRIKEGKKGREIGWPRFRGRQHTHRAFTMQDQSSRHTRWALKLPTIGMVPVRNARRHDDLERLDGAKINRIVVSERAGRWWCSVMVERPAPDVPPPTGPTVGMDLGHLITLSDGMIYEPPLPLRRYARWIANWERAKQRRVGPLDPKWRAARKQARADGAALPQPSKRYEKARQHEQAMHLRAAHVRRDWLQQVTTDITRRYGVVITEGFDVRDLVKKDPKRKQSKRMRRTALDIGWGELRTMLAYKMERAGKVLLQLGRHELTDQSCSRCGDVDPRRDGLFRCPSCRHEDIRPRNTADLLERIGRGAPPPSSTRATESFPAGEAGVTRKGGGRKANARGAGKASSVRRRL